MVLAKAADVELGAEPVRVTFSGLEIASRLDTLGSRRLYLILRGLRASQQPGVLYHLYLNLPAGAAPASDDPRHAGTINFYAAGPGNSDPERIFYSVDITEAARTLRARNLLRDPMTVTVYPSGRPEAKAVVSRIELIEE